MTDIDPTWLAAFDAALLKRYAIDHVDAGLDLRLLSLYSNLPAMDAAAAYGEDYDLERVDTFWPPPGMGSQRR